MSYQLGHGADAIDLLRPAPGTGTDPRVTGCFPLIPYSGRIQHGRFSFNGQTHQLPLNFGDHPHSIHGTGWQSRWELESQADTKAVMVLDHPAGDWPFAFRARQSLRLEGQDLTLTLEVENTGSQLMPVGMGFHPYFPRHGGARLTADVDRVWMTDPECLPVSSTSLPDGWQLPVGRDVAALRCDNQFEPFRGPARISWQSLQIELLIHAGDGLDRLVVYAPEGEDFFCVEPVSHLADPFRLEEEGLSREETGLRLLPPGAGWCETMTLQPVAKG